MTGAATTFMCIDALCLQRGTRQILAGVSMVSA